MAGSAQPKQSVQPGHPGAAISVHFDGGEAKSGRKTFLRYRDGSRGGRLGNADTDALGTERWHNWMHTRLLQC